MTVNKLYNFYTHSNNYHHNKGGCSLHQCSFNESPPEINPQTKIKHLTQYENADVFFTDKKKAQQKNIYLHMYFLQSLNRWKDVD